MLGFSKILIDNLIPGSSVLCSPVPQIMLYCGLGASLVAQMVKNLLVNAGDPGLTPGLGRSPGEKNGYPLQYFCLENSMDRGDYSPGRSRGLNTTERLSIHT